MRRPNQRVLAKLIFALPIGSALVLLGGGFVSRVNGQTGGDALNRQTAAVRSSNGLAASGRSDQVRIYALRLLPGHDLRGGLEAFAKAKHLRAGFIITTVGSLDGAALRLADQSNSTSFPGKFEIVSLVGTLSPDGVHLHLSISDSAGKTIGGHLVEGCRIYTTAEIVIGEASGLVFGRQTDPATGYKELTVRSVKRRRRHT